MPRFVFLASDPRLDVHGLSCLHWYLAVCGYQKGKMKNLKIMIMGIGIVSAVSLTPFFALTQDQQDVEKALINFGECEECIDGELQALVEFCDAAIPYLEKTLYTPGPTEAYVLKSKERITEMCRKENPDNEEKIKRCVHLQLQSDHNRWGSRSATALVHIGGPTAMNILSAALRTEMNGEFSMKFTKAALIGSLLSQLAKAEIKHCGH